MKRWLLVLAVALVAAAIFGAGFVTAGIDVIWMGHPVVSTRDKYFPAQVWLSDYEIGLRDDGVVVWRKTPKQQGEDSQK